MPNRTMAALAALWLAAAPALATAGDWPPPRPLDAARLAAGGLRVATLGPIEMVTDLAPSPAVDQTPRVLRAAIPLWAERFGVSDGAARRVRMRIYLVGERARFAPLGLLPEDRADFPHGFARGSELWVVQQDSDYYRRALVLHEGTHSFMQQALGWCGPAWHMEGVAELCGGHAWDEATGSLRMATLPTTGREAPLWGRPAAVRAAAHGATAPLDSVRRVDNRLAMPAESYARVWGLAFLLDRHPRYAERFGALGRALAGYTGGEPLADDGAAAEAFDAAFDRAFADDRLRLEQEWRLFSSRIDYGYDVAAEAIDFRDGRPLAGRPRSVSIDPRRGWQPTGVALRAGERVRLVPSGRFVIGRDAAEPAATGDSGRAPAPGPELPCEAGGVTLDYYGGRPLGELQAAWDDAPDALVRAVPVGLGAEVEAPAAATLYLRVNDSPASRGDNAGALRVRIEPVDGAEPRP